MLETRSEAFRCDIAQRIARVIFEECVEARDRDKTQARTQRWIVRAQPRYAPRAVSVRSGDEDKFAPLPDRQNPVARAQVNAVLRKQAVGEVEVFKGFDADAGVGGQVFEIGILADHAPLDQNPIGADPDILAALFSRCEERRRKDMTQAVELSGGAGFTIAGLVVVL